MRLPPQVHSQTVPQERKVYVQFRNEIMTAEGINIYDEECGRNQKKRNVGILSVNYCIAVKNDTNIRSSKYVHVL